MSKLGVSKHHHQAKSSTLFIFINKVLLEHTYAHSICTLPVAAFLLQQ